MHGATKKRVILVGAGAVGVAYAHFLQKGGAQIAFFVKPHHKAELAAGVPVYMLERRHIRDAERLADFEVLTTPDEVAARTWDEAWLCMSSTGLRGPWLEPFLAALGPATTLVTLQPGAGDREFLAARFPEARLVSGLITLVAYQTPLPGEHPHAPGIAVWLPPGAKFPMRGPEAPARAALATIEAGGWKTRYLGREVPVGGAMASAVLSPHVAALEGAGWRFAGLGKGGWGRLAAAASREGLAITAGRRGKKPPALAALVQPWLMRAFLGLAAARTPFDFEVYLDYHFTKVRDQTEAGLRELIADAARQQRPAPALTELVTRVFGP